MQSNLEKRIRPFLTTDETLVQIEQPNPHQFARATVSYWLGAVTLAAILTVIAILWLDTPDALLLLFVPPLLLLVTVIVKHDKKKEARNVVHVTTDQRQFTRNLAEGA